MPKATESARGVVYASSTADCDEERPNRRATVSARGVVYAPSTADPNTEPSRCPLGPAPAEPGESLPALVWEERFEALGYDEVWTLGETITAFLFDEDASPPAQGIDWGARCLQVAISAGSGQATVETLLLDEYERFRASYELIVTLDETLVGNFVTCIQFRRVSGFIATVFIRNIAGQLTLTHQLWINDSAVNVDHAIAVDTLYRVELVWDIANESYQLLVNDVEIDAGAITLAALTTPYALGRIIAGTGIAAPNFNLTYALDNILVRPLA